MYKLILAVFIAFMSQSVFSVVSFEGKITTLEPTYLPQTIVFHMDTGNSTCPAGRQLKWSKSDVKNNKAVYSTLLAAFMSGKRIRFYVNEGDTNCIGAYIHLLGN